MGWMGDRFPAGGNGRGGGALAEAKPAATNAADVANPYAPSGADRSAPHLHPRCPLLHRYREEAVDRMLSGGLLVVPSAPTLKDIPHQPAYRTALLSADLVIPDSAYMVLIWNSLQGRPLRRLSGLKYLRELLQRPEVRAPGSTVWIMAGRKSAALNLAWLRKQGVEVPATHVYVAPDYGPPDGSDLADRALLGDGRPSAPGARGRYGGWRHAGTARLVSAGEAELRPGHSLYRSRDRISLRRPGLHSRLGRPPLPRLAAARPRRPEEIRAALLVCQGPRPTDVAVPPQAAGADGLKRNSRPPVPPRKYLNMTTFPS